MMKALLALFASICFLPTAVTATDDHAKSVEWSEALTRLQAGNARFAENAPKRPNQDAKRIAEVAKGQAPFAVILGCADSRLSPEFIFDQGLGDLFVVRVAGNLADPFGTASIEYAVEHLGARLIVVLGHERCGAVKAACDAFSAGGEHKAETTKGHETKADLSSPGGTRTNPFLNDLVEALLPSVALVANSSGDFLDNAIVKNVERNVTLLESQSPILRAWLKKGVKVVGARYDLDSGAVKFFSKN